MNNEVKRNDSTSSFHSRTLSITCFPGVLTQVQNEKKNYENTKNLPHCTYKWRTISRFPLGSFFSFISLQIMIRLPSRNASQITYYRAYFETKVLYTTIFFAVSLKWGCSSHLYSQLRNKVKCEEHGSMWSSQRLSNGTSGSHLITHSNIWSGGTAASKLLFLNLHWEETRKPVFTNFLQNKFQDNNWTHDLRVCSDDCATKVLKWNKKRAILSSFLNMWINCWSLMYCDTYHRSNGSSIAHISCVTFISLEPKS